MQRDLFMTSYGICQIKRLNGIRRIKLALLILLLFPFVQTLAAKTLSANNPIPRPEHPKPQFHRDAWLNLNGQWNFAFDFDLSGVRKGWPSQPSGLDKKIMVPF